MLCKVYYLPQNVQGNIVMDVVIVSVYFVNSFVDNVLNKFLNKTKIDIVTQFV